MISFGVGLREGGRSNFNIGLGVVLPSSIQLEANFQIRTADPIPLAGCSRQPQRIARDTIIFPAQPDEQTPKLPTCFSDFIRYSCRRFGRIGEVAEWPIAPLC